MSPLSVHFDDKCAALFLSGHHHLVCLELLTPLCFRSTLNNGVIGCSVGDVVADIALIFTSPKSLKAGEAAPLEYQDLVKDLNQLKLILQQIETLQSRANLTGYANAIRATAISCRVHLSEILESIEKFRPALGTVGTASSTRTWHRAVRKVQWTVAMTGSIAKLRPKIDRKISTLLLLRVMSFEKL